MRAGELEAWRDIDPPVESARTTRPNTSTAFDWMMVVLCFWLEFGAVLDARAHRRFPELESFFTPWHTVLYSGFLAVSGLMMATWVRNRRKGYGWRRALPCGYGLSAVGGVLFAVGGVADMIWHLLFGIEVDIEALVSPSHLLLGYGAALICTGPLRSGWRSDSPARGWLAQLPMVLSLALLVSVFGFFTAYAHPLGRPWAAFGNQPTNLLFSLRLADPPIGGTSPSSVSIGQALGVAGILLQTGLLMGAVLVALRRRRWSLPRGSLTIIFSIDAMLIGFMRDQTMLIPGAVAGGIVCDILLAKLEPSPAHPRGLRLFAGAVPALYYSCYFLTLFTTKGVWWSVHMVTGSILLAGFAGWLLSYVLVAPGSLAPAMPGHAAVPGSSDR